MCLFYDKIWYFGSYVEEVGRVWQSGEIQFGRAEKWFGRTEKYTLTERRNTVWQNRELQFGRSDKYSLAEQRNTV